MKKLMMFLTIIQWLCMGVLVAQEPDPIPEPEGFECVGGYIAKATSDSTASTLYRVTIETDPLADPPIVFTAVGAPLTKYVDMTAEPPVWVETPIMVNNMGFSRNDGLIYGVAHSGTPIGIVMIDSAGVAFLVKDWGDSFDLPNTGIDYLAGDVIYDFATGNEHLMVSTYGNSNNGATVEGVVYLVSLDDFSVTEYEKLTPVEGLRIADWAANPVDGCLYGASQDAPNNSVWKMELAEGTPNTANITKVNTLEEDGTTTLALANSQPYGAVGFNGDGTFFIFHNDTPPSISSFTIDTEADPVTAIRQLYVENGPGAAYNDGAMCNKRIAQLEVEKQLSLGPASVEPPSDDPADWVWEDADAPTGPQVAVGQTVFYKIIIENTGTITLDLSVEDNLYQTIIDSIGSEPDPPHPQQAPLPASIPPNGPARRYEAIYHATTVAGQVTNTLTVTGTDAGLGLPEGEEAEPTQVVTDDANYFGVVASLLVEKKIAKGDESEPMGAWADSVVFSEYDLYGYAWYRISVTNTGTVALEGLTIADDLYPGDVDGDVGDGTLAPEEEWVLVIGPYDITETFGHVCNTVTVTAPNYSHEYTEALEGIETLDIPVAGILQDTACYGRCKDAFTPGFWKNHAGEYSHNANKGKGKGNVKESAWPEIVAVIDLYGGEAEVLPEVTLGEVFPDACLDEFVPEKNNKFFGFEEDVPFAELTLIQALQLKGGGGIEGAKSILFRAAVASLLNVATFGEYPEPYDFSLEELIDMVEAATCPEAGPPEETEQEHIQRILDLAEMLDNFNNSEYECTMAP